MRLILTLVLIAGMANSAAAGYAEFATDPNHCGGGITGTEKNDTLYLYPAGLRVRGELCVWKEKSDFNLSEGEHREILAICTYGSDGWTHHISFLGGANASIRISDADSDGFDDVFYRCGDPK